MQISKWKLVSTDRQDPDEFPTNVGTASWPHKDMCNNHLLDLYAVLFHGYNHPSKPAWVHYKAKDYVETLRVLLKLKES